MNSQEPLEIVQILVSPCMKNCKKFSAAITYMYRISSYSFRGNDSFLDLETQMSQYIRPKVRRCAETIQRRKLFKGENYMRKYGTSCPTVEMSNRNKSE